MARIAAALDLSQRDVETKQAAITDLDRRLNVALASRIEQLQRYRSDFFGRLRTLLESRTGIQVVGDRFVFQSEVLFPVGSAEMTPAGIGQMTTLAITIKQIAAEIPGEVSWVLRVDGHTDRTPVRGGVFASNWELSAARAINVVKFLIAAGVPAERLAATAFGEFQPLTSGDSPDTLARDRRIELRLTDR
jgi:chemotaxis protein MotB